MPTPAVILANPKYPHNVAAAIRACSCFDVTMLFWTGKRVDPSRMARLPREERMKGYREVQWQNSDRPFDQLEGVPVCIELKEGAIPLNQFVHPENAVYLFGPEDGSVPQVLRRFCHYFVYIPSRHCLNLSAALNVVLYDRVVKLWQDQPFTMEELLLEHRGPCEILEVPGWDGK